MAKKNSHYSPQAARQAHDAPHSPTQNEGSQTVYMARAIAPEEPEIPEEALRRHHESKHQFPELNLSKGEYVISAVRRHPIGLISIWFVTLLIVVLIVAITNFLSNNPAMFDSITGALPSAALLAAPLLLFCGLVVLGGIIATYVYLQNKFFLTNESVMQHIQVSLFSRKEQTISLLNIEDASYRQHGILQHILNYGNIRLSTQGEETTYRFSYVSNPKKQISLLNDAVEAFKNGRPFDHADKY